MSSRNQSRPVNHRRRIELLPSTASCAFGDLQIQGNPLSVDEHHASVDELLAGTVVFLIAAQCREGEKEFNGFSFAGCSRSACQMYGSAETDPIKVRLPFEVGERGPNQMRYMIIKCRRGQLVSRSGRGLRQSRV